MPDALGESADDDGHEKHDAERDCVLEITDREREERRYEKKVESGHADECCEDRCDEAVAARDEHDPEQVRHDDVGQLVPAEKEPRDAGRYAGCDRRFDETRKAQGRARWLVDHPARDSTSLDSAAHGSSVRGSNPYEILMG